MVYLCLSYQVSDCRCGALTGWSYHSVDCFVSSDGLSQTDGCDCSRGGGMACMEAVIMEGAKIIDFVIWNGGVVDLWMGWDGIELGLGVGMRG